MAGKLTNYAENKLLDHVLMNTAYPRPANLWLALCTADPGEGATGANIVEPVAMGYARQPCDDWGSAASRAIANDAAITYSVASGNWGTITHFAVLDSVTAGAGNVLVYGTVTPNKAINTGDIASIEIGDLDVSWDAGGVSDYLANALLDHLLAGSAWAQPAQIYVALSQATLADSDTGTHLATHEPGENYARIKHDDWHTAAAGASSNSGAVIFAKATGGSWGTIAAFALVNTLVTGNILLKAAVTTAKHIAVGDTAKFLEAELDCTMD